MLSKHPSLVFVLVGAIGVLSAYVAPMVSGWNALAKRFRFRSQFSGESWSFRKVRMRFYAGYLLTVGADQSGLYLSVFPPFFSMLYPPLLVPWSEVTIAPGFIDLVFKKRELRLGLRESIPLRISVSLLERLQKAARGAWPFESEAG